MQCKYLQYIVAWWQKTSVTLRRVAEKGLSPPSNGFGCSQKTFCNHPNTETDTENDADQAFLYSHQYVNSIYIII